ncbi:MAG: hypothetical protein ACXW2T_07935 [Allosphingosinicella sp.]
MGSPAGNQDESSLGDLFGRLGDDGRAFVKAEAGLYKAIALRRAGKAKSGAIALVAAALLADAALIVLLVGIALELSVHVGWFFGGLIAALGAGLIAFLLVRYGSARMKALSGDEEERKALAAGERLQ